MISPLPVELPVDMDESVRKLFDATPVAMILSRPDGSFEYVNPAMCKLLGYTSEEIYQKDLIISHPDDLEVNAVLRARLHSNPATPVIIEKRYLHKSGTEIPALLTIAAQYDEHQQVTRFIAQIVDLREQQRHEESVWLLANLLEHTNDAIIVLKPETGQIVACNQLAYDRLGYSQSEMLCMRITDINKTLDYPDVSMQLRHQGNMLLETEHTRKDGSKLPVESSIAYITQGQTAYLLIVARDISQRKQSEALIWRQAHYDTLTQLPNRRLLFERLGQTIATAQSTGQRVALLYLDLDRFKEVNDSLGHNKGDELLVAAAKRLKACIRHSDTLARQGGDEFTIVLGELDSADTAERIARDIMESLSHPFHLDTDQAYISTSIGIAFFPEDGDSSEALFTAADQAMYAAKARGRNCYARFTESMQKAALERLQLIKDLRLAITENQLQLVYQPIVNLTTGSIDKAEALLRWHHPQRGMISPVTFIPLAEETGLICEIGDWVFRHAAAQAAHWRKRFHPGFQVSINTSPIQYRDERNRMGQWISHLAELHIPGSAVVMEITEGVLMDSREEATQRLLDFRAEGVDVSLDDFGTGYSSLAYLKKFDIDFIKIDRSFVSNLETDADDKVLCEAIIAMAHKLGIRVIAEGIETQEQHQLLLDAGCDYGQGYLFSKPISAEILETQLEALPPAHNGQIGHADSL